MVWDIDSTCFHEIHFFPSIPFQKARHLTSRPLLISSRSHLTWKTSTLSVLSSSVPGSSADGLLSLTAAPEHTCDEPVYTKSFETLSGQESHSDCSSPECMSQWSSCMNLSDLRELFIVPWCFKQLRHTEDAKVWLFYIWDVIKIIIFPQFMKCCWLTQTNLSL